MNTAAVTKHVVVFRDPREKIYKMTPGTLTVRTDDEVIFHNVTQAGVNVQFPDQSPFAKNSFDVSPGTPVGQVVIRKECGPYPYDAFVQAQPDRIAAQGSKPIIIILD